MAFGQGSLRFMRPDIKKRPINCCSKETLVTLFVCCFVQLRDNRKTIHVWIISQTVAFQGNYCVSYTKYTQ